MDPVSTTPMSDDEKKAMHLLKRYTYDDHPYRRNLAKQKLNELLTNIADRDLASSDTPHMQNERSRHWFRGGMRA